MSAKSSPTGNGNLTRNSLREGDYGIGIPQSRMKSARVLNEEDSTDRSRKRDDGLQRQSEERPLQPDTAKEMLRLSKDGSSTKGSLREGDHGLGLPRSRMEGARALSAEEIAEAQRQRDEDRQRQFEERLRQLDTAGDSFRLPASILRVATWIGLTVASVLGLLLVGQGAALIGDIKTLSPPFDWIAGVSATFFAAILGWLILRLGVALLRLRRSPVIRMRGLQALEQRKRWQHLVSERLDEGKRELGKYLKEYEIDGDTRRRLGVLGVSEDDCRELKEVRRSLLESDVPISAGDWLVKYRDRFQRILDDTAKRRVGYYARNVVLGTAVARVAVVDQAIVLYSSTALVKDLMFIYRLRPGFGQATVILARSIRNTYLAGLLQEVSEEGVAATLEEIAPDILGKLGEKITGGVIEGAANALLINRLGKQTIQLLQPVHPTERS